MAKDKATAAAEKDTAAFEAAVLAAAQRMIRDRAKAEKRAKADIAVARRTPGLHVLPLLQQDTDRNTLAHVIDVIPGVGRLVATIRQVMDATGAITVEGVYGANPARFRSGDVATAETAEGLAKRLAVLAKAKADKAPAILAAAVEAYNAAAESHVFNVKAKADDDATAE